jgi:hypothetical protein
MPASWSFGLLLALMDWFQPGQVVRREPQRSGGVVVVEMVRISGARDDQYVRSSVQRPGQADLCRGGVVGAGESEHLVVLGAAGAGLAPGTGDGEERHERYALLTAGAQELVLLGAVAETVGVLHATVRAVLGTGEVDLLNTTVGFGGPSYNVAIPSYRHG